MQDISSIANYFSILIKHYYRKIRHLFSDNKICGIFLFLNYMFCIHFQFLLIVSVLRIYNPICSYLFQQIEQPNFHYVHARNSKISKHLYDCCNSREAARLTPDAVIDCQQDCLVRCECTVCHLFTLPISSRTCNFKQSI